MLVKVECSACGGLLGSWSGSPYMRNEELFVKDEGVLEGVVEGDSRNPEDLYVRCPICGSCESVFVTGVEERDELI